LDGARVAGSGVLAELAVTWLPTESKRTVASIATDVDALPQRDIADDGDVPVVDARPAQQRLRQCPERAQGGRAEDVGAEGAAEGFVALGEDRIAASMLTRRWGPRRPRSS
jgi:hypothetical protein